MSKKILIATDSFPPIINGVSTTILNLQEQLAKHHTVLPVHPAFFETINYPPYPEIKLSVDSYKIREIIKKFKPDHIHIATEGPIGLATKIYCDIKKYHYTTSYHTQFPEYLKEQLKIPITPTYNYMRWFHKKSKNILVPSKSIKWKLKERGFKHLKVWTRGVNHSVFHPNYKNKFKGLDTPIYLYFGRVSGEKNIEFFLNLKLPGTKIVIGDGPDKEKLEQKYPHIFFLGYKTGEDLAAYIASADISIFPSKTDTFGITIIESLACGTPVVGFDVYGPTDIISHGTGYTVEDEDDFEFYCNKARYLQKSNCIQRAKDFTWEECASIFMKYMVKI